MKRILSIALIFVLCFTLFACGDENNTDPTTTTTTQNSTTITTTLRAETTTAKPVVKYIYSISDGGAVITGVVGGFPGSHVVIPETLDGYPVVGIDSAFGSSLLIESVTIPKTLKFMTWRAFLYCENLTSIHISDLSAWIEADITDTLSDCTIYLNGEKIDFSGNFVIPEGTEKIGENAFFGRKEMTGVTIPDSVTSIGVFAFSGCENLFTITIPESVKLIREYAFEGCTGLGILTLLGSTSIYYGAFDGCWKIKDVNISSLQAWFENDFHPEGGGASTGNPLHLGAVLFLNDDRVMVDFVGDFVIPEGTKSIGNYTLGFSDEITSITIPSSVSKICECAFDGDFGKRTNLKKVNITDLAAWCEIDFEYKWSIGFMGEKEVYEKGYYSTPLDSADLYLNGVKVDFSGDFAIPEGAKKIGDLAFCDFDEMTSATIPSSVTSIGKLSFAGCDNLKSVTIPDSVTSIEDCAFTDCYNVTIHAKKDSYAYKYATDNNINVVALD